MQYEDDGAASGGMAPQNIRDEYVELLHKQNENIFPEDLIVQFSLSALQLQNSSSPEILGKISKLK